MNKKFTKLIAALALLVFMTPSLVAWGQTRTTQTASYGFETGDEGWTATTFVTNNTAITAHGGSKYGATNGTTADVKFNTIVASPQSLTCYYSKTTTNTNANSKFHIQVSTNNSTWTTVASGLGMDQVTKGTWYELTADLSSYSDVYVRVRYDGTTGVRALDDITLTYEDGQSPSTDPEITFDPATITLDEVMVGNQVSTTFSVSQANLTSGITLSVDNGSLSPSSIAQGAAATTVTWTYTPTTAGAISATVTATSGETTETLAISGTAIAPVEGYDVDFEYATDMYPNWTFNNMTTYQTGSITAHGGTYYGTTGGKSTASLTTTSTVANPGMLTCYVSKQTTNTTSSTWYIQVSEDGSTWTEVNTQSATSMAQGTWEEFTADLNNYTNVYVRVYYSGSTAVRNIDDLTLTTYAPTSVATTTTINVPANFNNDLHNGTSAGTLTATVAAGGTAISGATVTWSSSNTGVATIDANGAVTLVAVGTTTITASYAGVEDEYKPSSDTYELTVIDSYAPGTVNNPYTVTEAIAATPSSGSTDNVYIHGIVSAFYGNGDDILDDNTHRYYISDDGNTTTQLLVYNGKGLNNVAFSNANDLLVGDEITILGKLKMYSNAPEVDAGNYIVSLVRPSQYTLTNAMTNVAEYHVFVGDDEIEFDNNNQVQVRAGATVYVSLTMEDCYALNSLTLNSSTTGVTEITPGVYYSFVMPEDNATIGVSTTQATQYTLTVVGGENVTFDMLAGAESNPVSLTNGAATICEQLFVTIANLTANSGLILQSVTLTAGGSTTTLTLENGFYHFNMPSGNATLTFTTITAPSYTLATSIESGKSYIIVGWAESVAYAMGEQNSNNRAAHAITVNGSTAIGGVGVHEFVVTSLGEGYYSIYDEGYLYAASSGSNHLKTENQLDENHNGEWKITVNSETGVASVAADQSDNRNVMQFNQSNKLFSCYASASQHPVYFYVKDETPVTETYTKTITANTWYFIASPVGTAPTNVDQLTDLYFYDEQDHYWRNKKVTANANGFNFAIGKGYLGGNETTTVTLSFTGTPITDETYYVPVTCHETISDHETPNELAGWNLVGNPFACNAKVDRPFFTFSDGTLVAFTKNKAIAPCEGVMVQAAAINLDQNTINYENVDEYVTFTKENSSNPVQPNQLQMTVAQQVVNRDGVSAETVDNAIVSFNEGNYLEKFVFNSDLAKLYIPQGGMDFAIVSNEGQGNLPVNFKATEDGTYTITVNPEGVEMNYLHLIDNMTGNDIDLLMTPSYSFNATTNDYESRFRLVFASNGASTGSATDAAFAFMSDGNWIINNAGEATLQVIDLNGRILSSERVNGSVSKTVNATPGVYMLRLINGENVMVQKIVVR